MLHELHATCGQGGDQNVCHMTIPLPLLPLHKYITQLNPYIFAYLFVPTNNEVLAIMQGIQVW